MGAVGDEEPDLTRKQRREQARAQRKELEEAAVSSARRRARLIRLGGVAAVVIVVVVVIALLSGGKSKPPAVTGGTTSATAVEVSKLIGGIPQSGNTLGSPTAPVTLQYFGDLECPICREFTLGALPTVIPKWVRTGKLRIEYHSLETATREPEVFKTQQIAALAAGKQDKAWYFIETFYHEQGEEDSGYVTESYLHDIASQIPGLNLTQWISDRNDAELANQVSTDAQTANEEGFNGTPSFLIGRSGGATSKLNYTTSPADPAFVNEAVEKLLT